MLPLFVLTCLVAQAISEGLSCYEQGFSPDGLTCNNCDKLAEVVEDAELVKECRGCCTEAKEDNVKFVSALIEYCN